MMNSRDSYTDFSPSKKENIEVPYRIGTIIEGKDNPDILARICQYRIIVKDYKQIIYVGLSTDIQNNNSDIDCEITVEELEEKWKKTDKPIIGKLNPEQFIKVPEFRENYKQDNNARLVDIKGYWDMTGFYEFNDQDMWEGQLLLSDDGWFEGLVVDANSSYSEDRFIFGVYHPEKVIELYKFTPIEISSPFVFHGRKNVNGYDGQFEAIGLFGPVPYGSSLMTPQEVKRDHLETEIENLKNRIQRYKQEIMDETGKEFYENAIAMRKNICEIILRNYEGKGFTSEETERILKEWQPIVDRVMNSTEEEAKKLIKKMPDYYDDEDDVDDDDLPF